MGRSDIDECHIISFPWMFAELVLKRRLVGAEARGLDFHRLVLDSSIAITTTALELGLRSIDAGCDLLVLTDLLEKVLTDVSDVVGLELCDVFVFTIFPDIGNQLLLFLCGDHGY